MKIITLTLNPAFDVHCHVARFAPYHENLADVTARDAGGKGVNISRALTKNGVQNTALVVLGEENAEDFRRMLEADGLCTREILIAGRIRENITVHTDTAPETRISFAGFDADGTLLERVEDALGEVDGDTVVTLTGRVPDGIPMPDVKALLRRLQEKGVRIVIDSRSFTLADLIGSRPWLIKPNEEEIGAYLGRTAASLDEVMRAAEDLHRRGITNVMISMGEKGAYLACDAGNFRATPPSLTPLSTVGAGDSSIAGFLAATAADRTAAEALRTAVAYGSAACLCEGTQPPRAEDIAKIYGCVSVSRN